MGAFLSYSIVSGLLMLSMFLAYKVFLARENQHGYNRAVLLAIYAVSFGLLPLAGWIRSLLPAESQATVLPESQLIIDAVLTPASGPLWGTALIWVFIAGMAVVAARTLRVWLRLLAIVHSGQRIERDGYTLVLTDDNSLAPFSWMRFIVISRADYEGNCQAIAVHEMKHIACRHWLDLLVAQIVCIVNWFNPAAWLMRDELMLVHEYQADMAVIDQGHNPQEYQMLLIKKAVGARFPSLANSLNHSKLKKRITMMYKEKSGAGRKFKALALVPMLALALSVTAVPAVRAAVSTISSSGLSASKDSENPLQDHYSVRSFAVKSINNHDNRTTVVVKGENLGSNLSVSGATFTTKGRTYEATSISCQMTNGVATITAGFPFLSEFENSSMTLTINGEEIPFDLENFFDGARSARFASSPDSLATSPSVIYLTGSNSSLPADMKIYIDGQECSRDELNALNPSSIASITVDRQGNAIRITTRNQEQ